MSLDEIVKSNLDEYVRWMLFLGGEKAKLKYGEAMKYINTTFIHFSERTTYNEYFHEKLQSEAEKVKKRYY
jgi:hypothetical protein